MSDKIMSETIIASIQSKEDLIDNKRLEEIKLQNEIFHQTIENKNNEKKLDDTEAMLHNAKILNLLSKRLVKLFFRRFLFCFWIIFYGLSNSFFYYCFGEQAKFYLGLIDKIALFIIVCILGKFLKDSLSLFIGMFKK